MTGIETGYTDHASGLQALADRHGVSLDAVRHLVQSLERGGGTMAQFDHPDLGGMGQWFSGGMTMVGRMFDDGLKARVDALCSELSVALPPGGFAGPAAFGQGTGAWWPAGLGQPASSGSQNGLRYAYFPQTRRLAIESGQGVAVYDTGEHHISGVSQSNGSVGFTGPSGTLALDLLRRIDPDAAPEAPVPAPPAPGEAAFPQPAFAQPAFSQPDFSQPAPATAAPQGDVLATIERLAALYARGVLTEREFADKKAELLARL